MTAGRFMSSFRRLSSAALVGAAVLLLTPDQAMADVPVPPEDLLLNRNGVAVSEADVDFVIRVRLAGLWEIPAGEMAQDLSDSTRIKQIGQSIADQHAELDQLAKDAAAKLDIDLPDEPNADQKGWLAEMEAAQGTEFDAIYIDRLRAAHGKIFPAIATIRAGTRNDTIRKLAQQANQFVMTHMTLLESSNIVDFKALPTAPAPAAATSAAPDPVLAAAGAGNDGDLGFDTVNMPVLLAALAAGLAVGAVATHQIVNNRRPGYRNRRARYSR
ncbi:DUF4142 domain-containing protein [Actinoplanes rectilineatus]|uniref:DUF4142 domain-containing protein n=1 Tax=Actinoplanes rectilineatus TaxID=113571 RepID=UPI000AF7D088|nr:DUF4142 domain-containing protein [Actinoplanes rectilineatus]